MSKTEQQHPELQSRISDVLESFEEMITQGAEINEKDLLSKFQQGSERDLAEQKLHELFRLRQLKKTESLTHIDRFENRGQLGIGAFGTVYRCFDPMNEREVAVKLLRKSPLIDQFIFRSLKFEIKSLSRLSHPNIVRLLESGFEGEQAFIVMQLIDGQTLKTVIEQEQVSLIDRVKMMRDVADALEYTHTHDVVHRDIKPSNILVEDETGQAFLTDFGIARVLDETKTIGQLYNQKYILGTIGYLSPEQYQNMKSVDHRSDIYSFGLIMFETIVGRRVFEDNLKPEEMYAQMCAQTIKSANEINPEVDKSLSAIISSCLEFDPNKRYSNSGEVRQDIENWLSGQPISKKTSFVQRFNIGWHVTIAILCIGLVIGGFSVWNTLGNNDDQVKVQNPAEILIPGEGNIKVQFEVLPLGGPPTQIRVYPLLDSGEPDGANELVANEDGLCRLNSGYYYIVVERGSEFREVIRQIQKDTYLKTESKVCSFNIVDGTYYPARIEFHSSKLNANNGIVVKGFRIAYEEFDIENVNWEWAIHHAEEAGCLIATKSLLEQAGDQIVDSDKEEWTLTSNGVHIEMKHQTALKSWFFVYDKDNFEPIQRYYRDADHSFRLVRRLEPYSNN